MKKQLLIIIGITFLFVLVGCSTDNKEETTEEDTTDTQESSDSADSDDEEKAAELSDIGGKELEGDLSHAHGMGYEENGERILFGTHIGLRYFEDGTWYEVTENQNDFMGFTVFDEGFYTSGHPSAQSDLPNPIGIQKSVDGAQNLESIDFVGETDFHFLTVGYKSHDLLLYNPDKNSKLDQGFHISQDEGESWKKVDASGLEGDYMEIALHPVDSNLVAVSTTQGVYLSQDGGNEFDLLSDGGQGIGVFFSEDTLYYSTYSGNANFIAYDLEADNREELNLPQLNQDAPLFISQNPQNEEEFAIYTIEDQAYISEDGTDSWKQILKDGSVQ
ncbi:hypothetical protein CEY16_05255 [Halalkalibacillus sediminis]|uniref:Sortilin N-terminal domain-containing protein n=1 Tax=Halalkalibacillus sediminis TaxID=2018042 RepID=A0A2I0QYH1_9BACI|nr:hypothetical protein [Halalkalibacillus sediminis]PKR79160.1 hypothetical protein CEY16_05255 [Halalkalibacillus sediminis]